VQTNYGQQRPHRGTAFAWAILGVILVAVIAFFAVIAYRGYPTMPMTGPGYPDFGWWFFFPFGIFFFLIILFFVSRMIFWPMGWGYRRRYWYGYGDANEILRQRYARGEITKEQFDQMKRDLEQHG
jgi:putative membrane protein